MEFLAGCEEMARAVEDIVGDMLALHEGGRFVRMGADGTPTREIDQAAEDSIVDYITTHALCRTLVSEECGKRDIGGDKGTIFLDPVDGTHNALSGIPFYALSIAYAEDGVVQQGFVRDLAHRETFTAMRGKGAFLDGRPSRVSRTTLLEESAMSVYGRKFNPGPVLSLGQKIRRWRLLGASALELCYVGAGRLDGFIDLRATLRVTDAAAGMLVCEEAGGKVSDLEGGRIRFPDEVTVGKCLVASNGSLHGKVIEYLR
ncbi:MAG TPA: bifunctional fructose-bisphosphatase/inositol-phosphate phosphatase [Methanomicrobiales archaeon]|jgi:myo-inositol-1(or 4)-monophosphatase|nr:bifunctional fructose-bisphosphatase/inositol-phosphate phosphatase [Methanomicrobiales archaeon]